MRKLVLLFSFSLFISFTFSLGAEPPVPAKKKPAAIEKKKDDKKSEKKKSSVKDDKKVKAEEKKVEKKVEKKGEKKGVKKTKLKPIFKMKTKKVENVIEYKSGIKYDNASVGMGISIPYGSFGISSEYTPIKQEFWHNFAFVTGLGMNETVNRFFVNAGLRYYILEHEYQWRPRLTILYGNNAIINIADIRGDGERIKEAHHGLNIGVGLQWMIDRERRFGFDFDMVAIAYSTVYERLDELQKALGGKWIKEDEDPGRLKLSFGIRVAF